MKIIKLKTAKEVGAETSKLFIKEIKRKPNAVLGLATGSSPIDTYKDLIAEYKNGQVSFKDVTTFNLDEYIGIKESDEHSYRYFMNKNLFEYIDIDMKNTHIPSNSNLDHPEKYDEQIEKAGGIDLQLLGLGVNGHIGFNEPGTKFDSKTSIVNLTQSTIDANARFFKSKEEVPTKAVSMGLGSIMKAKKIILIATGTAKAEAVRHLIHGDVTMDWPVTVLKNHPDVTVIIDDQAGDLINK